MSKLLALVILMTNLVLFCGCGGGGDKDGPPPPTSSPLTDQGRYDLLHLVQRTEAACQGAIQPAFISVAQQIQGGGPRVPVQPNLSPCANGVREVGISAATLYGNQGGLSYAMPWLISRGPTFANGIAASLAQRGFPINASTIPLLFTAGAGMLANVNSSDPTVAALKLQILQGLMTR